MSTIRVGAIGCGYWGPNLIRNFVEIPEAKLVAVADLDGERLLHIRSRFPEIEVATQDYEDFFQLGLDAVVIATPPQTHFRLARQCLEHGLHVLVEKPLTLESRDAEELIEVARKHDRILMVGHTFEYNPAVRALKEIIDSGKIGEIYYIDAVRASLGLYQTSTNVLWDLAPHDISILRYIVGAEPVSVSIHGTQCVQEGVTDVAYAALTFPGGIMAHIRMSWLDPHKTRRITVVGSEKMVIYDDVESLEKIKIYDKGVKVMRHTDTYGDFQFAYHYGDVVSPYIRFDEPLRLQCLHFLDCIRENKKPQTDGLNGLRVTQILEAAERSLTNNGMTVPIEFSREAMNANGSDPALVRA